MQAIELSGRQPGVLSEYAWFMANQRGPKLAEQAAKEAIEADAGSSTAWAALGQAQFRLHRRAEAEASLRRALQLNPNDIYAQSAMVALFQDRRDDAKAEALVGLLEEHAGTEDLIASVRDDAKQRQIARMLLERKVDLEGLDRQPRRYGWIWLLGGATVFALASSFLDPWRPHRRRAPDALLARVAAQMARLKGSPMNRFFQVLLIISTAGLSWLLMMVVHEYGHVWHGWLSGAQLVEVHLPLVGFSRTEFAANPHPLFVAWGGPLWGCLWPLAILVAARLMAKPYAYLATWFAGFCLIANGGYLLGGAFLTGGADDGGVILQNGGATWQLLAFGLPAIAVGLYLWNGLGPYFGFGESRGKVDRKAAVAVTVALLIVACVEGMMGHR